MLKPAIAYYDGRGRLHPSAKAALLAELGDILGYGSAQSGVPSALALMLVEKREEIERAFAQFDSFHLAREMVS